MCFAPQRHAHACTLSTLQLPKVVRTIPNMECFVHFDFDMYFAPQRRALFSTSQFPKVVRVWRLLHILTWKCASCHNGVHFFRHRNFQKWSGPGLFCAFWLRNVFCATTTWLFRHRNFQKWSEPGVFCAFWLRNVLRATTACNFSSLIWPAGSAPAAVASLFFDLRNHKSLEKTQCFATFPSLLFICPYCRKFDL